MKQNKSCDSNRIQTYNHLVLKRTHKNPWNAKINITKFIWLQKVFDINSIFYISLEIRKYYKVKQRDNIQNSKFYQQKSTQERLKWWLVAISPRLEFLYSILGYN